MLARMMNGDCGYITTICRPFTGFMHVQAYIIFFHHQQQQQQRSVRKLLLASSTQARSSSFVLRTAESSPFHSSSSDDQNKTLAIQESRTTKFNTHHSSTRQQIRALESLEDFQDFVQTSKDTVASSPELAAAALFHFAQIRLSRMNESVSMSRNEERKITGALVAAIESWAFESKRGTMSIFALVDALCGLSIVGESQIMETKYVQPIVQTLFNQLDHHHVLGESTAILNDLGFQRWIHLWQAMHRFNETSLPASLAATTVPLYQLLSQRLTKGDAIARMKGYHLSLLLGKLANQDSLLNDEVKLVQSLSRRVRKKQVRSELSMSRMFSIMKSGVKLFSNLEGKDEIRTMTYTIIKEIANVTMSSNNILPVHEAAVLINALSRIEDNADDYLVEKVYQLAGYSVGAANARQMSFLDVALIMSALERWTYARDSKLVSLLLKCLVTMATNKETMVPPSVLNQILRCTVLVYRHDSKVMLSLQEVASIYLMDRAVMKKSKCNELSNFLWIMTMAQMDNDECLVSIVERILEPGALDDCTPKTATLILKSYVALLSRQSEPMKSIDYLDDLFGSLGEYLLSSRLSSADSSSAIYAYAKSFYIRDLGIFDHLVELFASQLDRAKTRQISQTLWACGKMVLWESDGEDSTVDPPYIQHARKMARCLASNSTDLGTKDCAQSIWACARLRLYDEESLSPLLERALSLVDDFTTNEISNIIWSMGKFRKVSSNHFKLVFRFIKILDGRLDPTTQEAANILYGLGKLDLREEEVFQRMSAIIGDQIADVSAEALGRTLWAHDAVHLSSQKLLDQYAQERLGLKTIRATASETDENEQAR